MLLCLTSTVVAHNVHNRFPTQNMSVSAQAIGWFCKVNDNYNYVHTFKSYNSKRGKINNQS